VDEDSNLVLDSEIFRHIEPGLSSYKDDPEGAAKSLAPLLEAAVQAVPKSHQIITPINLKATAGKYFPFSL
jgi:guanosine-diphosphatase